MNHDMTCPLDSIGDAVAVGALVRRERDIARQRNSGDLRFHDVS